MMTESRLCSKIRICEHIESVDEKKAFDVLTWMKEELKCNTINQLLIKILVDSNELFTNDALINIVNKINFTNTKNNKSTENNMINHNNKDQNSNTFPLLKLPTDIITTSSLYLNEKQLLCFEQCNRFLYKLINNSTFLKQCRNFKNFRLRDELLWQIITERLDLYKYSFANEFVFDLKSPGDHVDDSPGLNEVLYVWSQKTGDLWNSLLYHGCESYKYHSNWISTLFESIQSIYFDDDSMLLMDLIPIELLFDKNKSQLKKVYINDYWQNAIENQIDTFKEKYFYFLSMLDRLEPNVLELLSVVGVGFFGNSSEHALHRILPMSHLMIEGFSFDCAYLKNANFVSHLKQLTLSGCTMFVSNDYGQADNNDNNDNNSINGSIHKSINNSINISNNVISSNNNRMDSSDNLNNNNCLISIDTLRLLDMNCNDAAENLVDERVLREMNFQLKLKNLTIEITTPWQGSHIESVLTKQYLFNLENVNILVAPWYLIQESDVGEMIDKLFDILCDHVELLKYQFKQLNLGLHKRAYVKEKQVKQEKEVQGQEDQEEQEEENGKHMHAYAYFCWNSTINVDFINQQRNYWKLLQCVDDDDTTSQTYQEMKKMYEKLEQQWI